MPELATVLREVVDASAAPVTVEEVLGLPEAVPRNRPRWPLLAAAAAVVVLAGAAAMALRTAADDADDVVEVPATTTALVTPAIESCRMHALLRDGPSTPCPVTDDQAQQMLGLPVNEPDGIPEGWTLVNHDVRWYDAEEYGLPQDLADYNRSWWQDPDQVDDSVPCDAEWDGECWPPYVQVNVREAIPGDDPTTQPPDRRDTVAGELADGTTIWGTIGSPGLGDDLSTWISWTRDGRYYRLRSAWVPRATILQIANDLA
jgi:hypothetical protein